jgi:tRNA dimethylallyltransferase
MLVGGTGLYVSSLLRAEQSEAPESDPEYRAAILDGLKNEDDVHALWERLRAVDPVSAEQIHENNVKRVVRALEIYERTGVTKTELDRRSRLPSPEIFVGMITLDFHNRDTLYSRIDLRVDQMLEEGLVGEVESLYRRNLLPEGSTAAQAIGYKEIIEHLRGECTLSEAVEKIKLSTRRYAKRQLTWFRRTEGACTVFMDDEQGNMRPVSDVLADAVAAVNDFKIRFSEIDRNS